VIHAASVLFGVGGPMKVIANTAGEGIVRFADGDVSGGVTPWDDEWFRHISVSGTQVYAYHSCGTCNLIFKKLRDPGHRVTDPEAADMLGMLDVLPSDDILLRLARVLEAGEYFVLLLEGRVRLRRPGSYEDYFCTDVKRLWSAVDETEMASPGPRTAYYMMGEQSVMRRKRPGGGTYGSQATSVLMPLHSPYEMDGERVKHWEEEARGGRPMTALAVSVLLCKAPEAAPWDRESPFSEAILLSNCLLDGNHRAMAANNTGVPLRVLTFLKRDQVLDLDETTAEAVVARFEKRRPRA
jgi:hypothetical protein